MQILNNYVSDKEVKEIVEENDLTYPEAAARINQDNDTNFSEKTVGEHYRKYKEKIGERKKCIQCEEYFYISEGYNPNFCSEECFKELEKAFAEAVEPEEKPEVHYQNEFPEEENKYKTGGLPDQAPWYKRAMDWIGETLSWG